MKPRSSKARPWWLLPAVSLGAGLGLSLLALIPLMLASKREPRRVTVPPLQQLPAVTAIPQIRQPSITSIAPPVATQKPFAIPPPASVSGVASDQNAKQYDIEINYLMDRANILANGAEEMISLGDGERAGIHLKEANKSREMRNCLIDQLEQHIPFYQGKATCAAAVGSD